VGNRPNAKEFVLENYMASIFRLYCSVETTGLDQTKAPRASGQHDSKVQRVSDEFVASYSYNGNVKRFLQSKANCSQSIIIGCTF